MKKKLKQIKQSVERRRKTGDDQPEKAPRITNKTVAEHREEVLGSARKFIMPLQQSKHKIVLFSIGLFVAAVLTFFAYCTLALYKFQDSGTFLYRVTQVIPFPIARSGSQFIAYENYLFELRRYKHYYANQQALDFDTEAGQLQLAEYKRRALDDVINNAYIKQLASEHNVSVSDQEVEDEILIARSQKRLGNNEATLEDTIKQFWGWSLDDFKRTLRQQLLAQKVLQKVDVEANNRAESAINELQSGTDFAEVAKKYSDDPGTKDNGGEFGGFISESTRDLDPLITKQLFELDEGEYSQPFATSYGLEIVKVLEKENDEVRAAHILISFKDIESFVNDLKAEQAARIYISLTELQEVEQAQQ